jgi:arginase
VGIFHTNIQQTGILNKHLHTCLVSGLGKQIEIVGIPMDLGQDLRGVDMGPSAVRYAGLKRRLEALGYTVNDDGNIPVAVRDNVEDQSNQGYLPAIVESLNHVYEWTTRSIQQQKIPIFLGGDHSIAIGTIGAMSKIAPTSVIYIDAHGDYNTPETTPSGNVHGMPLAALLGKGFPELVNLGHPGQKISPENVVMIGIRDLDREERAALKASGITVYTMREIDELGVSTIMHQTLKKLKQIQRIHVSIDMDFMDPGDSPGVGTPVPGGLTYREAHLIMEILADSGRVASAEVTEVNPILDVENRTARIAVELLCSLFGKSIM